MSNKEKTTLVPKLRFPEFKANGDVICKKGNLLFRPVNNKDHNSDLPILAITQEHGAIPRDQIGYNVSVSKKSLENYKVVEVGDFIISLRSFQGGIEYSLFHGICSPAYIILRKKVDIIEQYYKYYFKTNKFIQDLNKDLEGIRDGKMVSYRQFSSILLPKPGNKEQQKIVDCLNSLDDFIVAEDKKLSALKSHKKGLMQKLFPAEGKTMPEWRFPKFRNSGEWEEKKLEEVGEIIGGGTPSKSEEVYWNGNIPWISSSDIEEDSIFNINKTRFITKEAISSSATKLCPIGTICIVSRVGVGKIALTDCELCTSQDFTNVINITENQVFMAYMLFVKMTSILCHAQGTSIKGITVGEIKNLKLYIPSINEQQKIADCLSSLDVFITAQTERIEALDAHKKGLMQGLFSSIEEVIE